MKTTTYNEISQSWCLMLYHEFAELQHRIPALSKLTAPNIIINPNLTSTLGKWCEETREVSISQSLFRQAHHGLIIEVFHHEVAHQIVSELYGIRTAQHHGEAFKRACKLLGIEARSRADFTLSDRTGPDRFLSKIQKLLALGTSANEHEAEAALTKARELALKHNLELVGHDLLDYNLRPVGPLQKRIPSHTWSICSIVSDFYFCLYICRNVQAPNGDVYRMIELYGQRENLDMGEYVFHFLLNQGEMAWHRYRRRNRVKGRRIRLSFLNGLYSGFREKLEAQTKRLADEKALIWLGDPKLDAFFKQRNPRVRTRSISTAYRPDAHAAGAEVGRQLNLTPGLRQRHMRTDGPGLLT